MRQWAAERIPAVLGIFGEWQRFQVAAVAAVSLVLGGVLLFAPHQAPVLGRSASPMEFPSEQRNTVPVFATYAQSGGEAVLAEPTPLNRLLSMALAQVPSLTPPSAEEPNLAGLSEIPSELIWNRPEKADEKGAPRPSFATFSEAQAQLPWDAVEPVPFAPVMAAAATAQPRAGVASPQTMASVEDVGAQLAGWLKTKITEIKGADRSRPLYHFELWLEPPAALKQQILAVSYEFSTPAIRPRSQASSDRGTGFRISAGGLACADEILVTLRFADGRREKVSIDGCELLS